SHKSDGCAAPKRGNGAWRVSETTSPTSARQSIRTSEEEKIALDFGEAAFDHPQHRPPPWWWLLGMIITPYSKGPPEFIQQVARIDPCGCDTLTPVAGGYQCGSFWIVHRELLQLTLHCFVKAGCYQLTLNHLPAASEARR